MKKKKTSKDFERIIAEVKNDFPEDPALQEVHIARKLIAQKAKKVGLGYVEYVRSIKGKHLSNR